MTMQPRYHKYERKHWPCACCGIPVFAIHPRKIVLEYRHYGEKHATELTREQLERLLVQMEELEQTAQPVL